MARQYVIQDSDDEEDNFSPIKIPVPIPPDREEVLAENGLELHVSHADRSGSTDPEFFQKVYEDQQQRAPPSRKVISHSDVLLHADCSSGNVEDAAAQTSSITEPTASRKRKPKPGNPESFADLTQVTTPGKPSLKKMMIMNDPEGGGGGGGGGMWGVPSSPVSGLRGGGLPTRRSARNAPQEATTYGKRDRSEAAVEAPSPAPTAKRARRGTLDTTATATTANALDSAVAVLLSSRKGGRTREGVQSSPQAEGYEDAFFIPHTESTTRASSRRKAEDADNAVSATQIADTQKAKEKIEVTLSRPLSSSEQLEYRVFSLSSQLNREGDETSLPLPVLQQQPNQNQKSSGATTVAVSTPSEFAKSSAHKAAKSDLPSTEIPMPASSAVVKRRKRKSDALPSSSPDVIATSTARSRKKSRVVIDGSGDDGQDAWDADEIGLPPERYVPRSSRRRQPIVEDDLPDTEPPGGYDDMLENVDNDDEDSRARQSLASAGQATEPILIMSSGQEVPEIPSPVRDDSLPKAKAPKKRGRKKKEQEPKETVVDEDVYVKPDTAVEPQARAVDEEEPAVGVDEATAMDEAAVASEEEERPKMGKRGRPKKSDAKTSTAPARGTVTDASAKGSTVAHQPLSETTGSNANPKRAPRQSTNAAAAAAVIVTTTDIGKGQENRKPGGVAKPRDHPGNPAPGGVSTATNAPVASAAGTTAASGKNNSRGAASAAGGTSGSGAATAGAGGPGKVSYRVGLSKKTRIAPLLKFLPK